LDFGKGWKGVCAGEFGHEEEGEDAVLLTGFGAEFVSEPKEAGMRPWPIEKLE